MSAFFATDYTIHFDDTMAYGSHHFLTGFKFQCAARETFMFGEFMYDVPGVAEELEQVHLFTADAYSRNLKSKTLGERVVVMLSLEEWGEASARFCYRVIDDVGDPVCAGFQTLVCADAKTGMPMQLPPKVREAMGRVRQIEEPHREVSFRDRVLAGGSQLEPLFSNSISELAVNYLRNRYPSPQVISGPVAQTNVPVRAADLPAPATSKDDSNEVSDEEVWIFAGQGAFDVDLLVNRISAWSQSSAEAIAELQQCESVIAKVIGGDAGALFSGSLERTSSAIAETPELMQPAIHLQNMLGGSLRRLAGCEPKLLTGHSFGEIAAMGLAGCFDLVTGVHIVCLRAMAVKRFAPEGGGLMVAAAPRASLETEIALGGFDQIVIAGRNHDSQTVLAGPKDQLRAMQQTLSGLEIRSMSIPSPTCFHHPILSAAAEDMLQGMRRLPISPARSPVFTCMGRRLISETDDIAEILASQLLRPFDLQGSVGDIVASGLSTFVDCGSSGSLSRLILKSGVEGIQVVQHEESLVRTPQPEVTSPAPKKKSHSSDSTSEITTLPTIAIVGSGCILPGGATSPSQLFESITQQRMGIVDVQGLDPFWSQDFYSEELTPDKSTSHLSGRVNNDDIRVPEGVDPQIFDGFTRLQKLLCISIAPLAATLEGAEKVMCLVGATADGFEDQDEALSLSYLGIDPANHEVDRKLNLARSLGRMPHDVVQEVFDIVIRPGLKVTLVDAACASSLYSVALGMNALETGKADAVIAGGCFCPGPGNSCLFSQFNGTTSTGCRPFDEGADGVVFSEAAAFVALRRLDDAKQFGMPVVAAVRATGLSSDGRSPSANVPQTKGQILSLKRCYANYDIDPKTIQAIEGHGTSTSVGDSTELETLRQFFSEHVYSSIPVHSLKGTLGHAGWAAGTASIIAACEYLRRRTFPAQACHSTPSEKLEDCSKTLRVVHSHLPLPTGPLRIAIDGFGFGGANAHVVLENLEAAATFGPAKRESVVEEELVFVACHQIEPQLKVGGGKRFDRSGIELPESCLVLPDICDDMDISQMLTVNLTEGVISKLPNFSDEVRCSTSVVLAFQGKTERGIEATARVMNSRFRRQLCGNESLLSTLEAGYQRARPSGKYTLQCMMPNVATGRAALLYNLNGPNFVVDAGSDSLGSAIQSASLLLNSGHESGTRLVIVAAIDAATMGLPAAQSEAINCDEFAAAVGIATRSTAIEQGWDVLAPVTESSSLLARSGSDQSPQAAMQSQVQALMRGLDPTQAAHANAGVSVSDEVSVAVLESENDACPIHTPAWIRRDLPEYVAVTNDGTFVFVAGSDQDYLRQLLQALPGFCSRFLIVVAGAGSSDAVTQISDRRLLPLDIDNEQSLHAVLTEVEKFQPEAIVSTDRINSWQLSDSLDEVARDNRICEATFMIAQDNQQRIAKGGLELWGLFPGAYNGSLHTRSGSVAGLIKSILREMPALTCGVLCTDDNDLPVALEHLLREREIAANAANEPEVSWFAGQRFVRRLRKVSAVENASPQVALDRNSVVVATGGARGVTAVMLESIANECGCHIIAFGRSPLEKGPPGLGPEEKEAWFYERFIEEHPGKNASEMKIAFEKAQARWEADDTIAKLNAIGGKVEYMQVDVTDANQVEQALANIHSRFGRIDLLIHGAGVQASMLLQDRTLADFRRTYSVKVVGLNNLVGAARKQVGFLPAVHVLTSAYSIFGNDGQHDYCAANETMDRLCDMTNQDPNTNWSSIAWLAWDGIGMTRGSEYKVLAKQRKLSGVDAQTGQRIFRDVISGRTGAAINVPVSAAEHLQYRLETAPAIEASCGSMIEVPINLAEIQCLPYHLVGGIPTLPGAWIVDCMVHAALKLASDRDSICEAVIDLPSFKRFVRYANQQNPNMRVFAQQQGDSIRTSLVLDVVHASGELLNKDNVCAEASISFRRQPNRLVSKLRAICEAGSSYEVRDPYCQGQSREVDLSGPFDCLGPIEIGSCGRRAKVNVDASRVWPLDTPALLLDAAWRVAAVKATQGDALFVPVQINQLIVPVQSSKENLAGAGSVWEIRSSQPQKDGDDVRWQRTEVIDEHGRVRIVVDGGFAVRRS